MNAKNHDVNNEKTQERNKKDTNIQKYTNKLIADTLHLRNKYFDEDLNIKNLKT
jgi:hypothetical protein